VEAKSLKPWLPNIEKDGRVENYKAIETIPFGLSTNFCSTPRIDI